MVFVLLFPGVELGLPFGELEVELLLLLGNLVV